jgi:hypothetical protein
LESGQAQQIEFLLICHYICLALLLVQVALGLPGDGTKLHSSSSLLDAKPVFGFAILTAELVLLLMPVLSAGCI